jgi:hypothetical protein
MSWEKVDNDLFILKVVGGWLIRYKGMAEYHITFIPDPDHKHKPVPIE